MIIIHAFISVKPEKREEFLQAADKVMAGSKSEEGNISYHLYEDIKEQNKFVMVEEWKDQAAIEFHRQAPHYQAFGQEAKELLQEATQVKVFNAEKLS